MRRAKRKPICCSVCREDLPTDAIFCPLCGSSRSRPRSGDDTMLGRIIHERYRIDSLIAEGASGLIYRGEHVELGKPVAIKILHHKLARDDVAIEQFRREAATLAKIDSDHVVKVFDLGRTSDGRLFFAMELIEGESLARLVLREGKLPIARAADILLQLAEALMEPHALGYLHRDLRPANVLLTQRKERQDFVRLLDFGLSALVSGQHESKLPQLAFKDPRYMSPEQAQGQPVDRRSDIYAVGIIGYEMVCGTPPFENKRALDVVAMQLEKQPKPLALVRPEVPTWLEAAILRCLAKRPDDRFTTVLRLRDALSEGISSYAAPERPLHDTILDPPRRHDEPPPADREAPPPAQKESADAPPRAPETLALEDGAPSTWHVAPRDAGQAARTKLWQRRAKVAAAKPPARKLTLTPERLLVAGAGGVVLGAIILLATPPGKSSGIQPASPDPSAPEPPVSIRKPEPHMSRAAAPIPTGAPLLLHRQIDALPARRATDSSAQPARAETEASADPDTQVRTGTKPEPATTEGTIAIIKSSTDPHTNGKSLTAAEQAKVFASKAHEWLQKGNEKQAETWFLQARRADPRDPDAIAGLGQVAYEQGRYQDAVVHFQEAVRVAPSRSVFHVWLGHALLGSEQAASAAAAYRDALEIDPSNRVAKQGLEAAQRR